jgi:beta-galactosidase
MASGNSRAATNELPRIEAATAAASAVHPGRRDESLRMPAQPRPVLRPDQRRFQACLTTEFIAWQVALVKEYAGPDQFVTQDVVGGYGRGDSDSYQIGQAVDVLAMNSQHPTQGGLDLSGDEQAPPPQGHWQEEGVSLLYFKSDLAWGARRSNFLVTESNPISVGGAVPTFPAYDGQWRQAAYAYISRGSNMVAYWHWHSLHYGHEIYSHGILNHDLEPNRCYRELSRIGAELRRHQVLLTDLRPDADIAFLYSQDSRYGLEFQPCLIRPGAKVVEADSRSYQRISGRRWGQATTTTRTWPTPSP